MDEYSLALDVVRFWWLFLTQLFSKDFHTQQRLEFSLQRHRLQRVSREEPLNEVHVSHPCRQQSLAL